MKLEDLMEKGSHLHDMKTAARSAAKKYAATDRKKPTKNPHEKDSYHGKVWQKAYDTELAKHPVSEARLQEWEDNPEVERVVYEDPNNGFEVVYFKRAGWAEVMEDGHVHHSYHTNSPSDARRKYKAWISSVTESAQGDMFADRSNASVAEKNFSGEKIYDEMEWVARMKEVGADGFAIEKEKGFPDMLIYAVMDKTRLMGTWNNKHKFGTVYRGKEGQQPGLRFEVGYRNSKRNLEWIKM